MVAGAIGLSHPVAPLYNGRRESFFRPCIAGEIPG